MLTMIAYHFTLANLIPPQSYLTRLDTFILGSNIIVFIALLEAVLTSNLVSRDKKTIARKIDYLSRFIFPVVYVVVITIIFALIYGLRAKTWTRISLKTAIDSSVSDIESLPVKAGDMGICITRLGPIGKVMIGDIKCEGQSIGPYIDANTEIEVVQVKSNHVIVKPKESKDNG